MVFQIYSRIICVCVAIDTVLIVFDPDSIGGLEGYEILKLHDADPFLGVELKFMAMPPCQRFLESYACGSLAQFMSQHASRLLTLPDGVVMETQLKAGIHTLDQSLQDVEMCLDHIRQSQVCVFVYADMTARIAFLLLCTFMSSCSHRTSDNGSKSQFTAA